MYPITNLFAATRSLASCDCPRCMTCRICSARLHLNNKDNPCYRERLATIERRKPNGSCARHVQLDGTRRRKLRALEAQHLARIRRPHGCCNVSRCFYARHCKCSKRKR